ncbi:MAG: hypothetical protein D6772_11965 [Bacteroidetes bacterium]|nr:MAG: hypothetical protein D6772_11965 [Bacteroidota bacterium]
MGATKVVTILFILTTKGLGLTQALRTLPAVQGTLAGVVRTGPDAAVRTGVAMAFGTSPNSERSDHRR